MHYTLSSVGKTQVLSWDDITDKEWKCFSSPPLSIRFNARRLGNAHTQVCRRPPSDTLNRKAPNNETTHEKLIALVAAPTPTPSPPAREAAQRSRPREKTHKYSLLVQTTQALAIHS